MLYIKGKLTKDQHYDYTKVHFYQWFACFIVLIIMYDLRPLLLIKQVYVACCIKNLHISAELHSLALFGYECDAKGDENFIHSL